MEQNTLYDDLELPKNCTSDEIKQKYRALAQIYHPDRQSGNEEKFKRIKLAYEILSDPTKRAHYDSTGEHYEDVSIDNEVFARLSNMISHHTQHINPDIDDLILKMKVDIHQAQHQTNNAIIEGNNIIKKLSTIAQKIKLKKEGENLLKSFVETKISQRQHELTTHRKTLMVFAKMLEVLEEYHFSLEEWQLLIKQ